MISSDTFFWQLGRGRVVALQASPRPGEPKFDRTAAAAAAMGSLRINGRICNIEDGASDGTSSRSLPTRQAELRVRAESDLA